MSDKSFFTCAAWGCASPVADGSFCAVHHDYNPDQHAMPIGEPVPTITTVESVGYTALVTQDQYDALVK